MSKPKQGETQPKTIYRSTHPSEGIEQKYSESRSRFVPFLQRSSRRAIPASRRSSARRRHPVRVLTSRWWLTGGYEPVQWYQSFTFPRRGCGGGALHKIRRRSTSPASIRPMEHFPRPSRTRFRRNRERIERTRIEQGGGAH
jgi:hypothetical protein